MLSAISAIDTVTMPMSPIVINAVNMAILPTISIVINATNMVIMPMNLIVIDAIAWATLRAFAGKEVTLGPSGHIMGMFHKLNRKGGYFLQCRGLHPRDLNLLS